MSDREEPDRKGFKVTDRRSFTAEGKRRPGAVDEEDAGKEGASTTASTKPGGVGEATSERGEAIESSKPPPGPAPGRDRRGASANRDEASFMDLLGWLATQASIALGEPHPLTGESHEDLRGASAMISMIEALEAKTKGNLSEEERAAVEAVLYQLRMQYVGKVKAGGG